jgi:hypothetical protein
MLEPHLVEIKHQGESKLWNPEPIACRKILHITLHWENRCTAATTTIATAAPSSKPAWNTFGRLNRWAQRVTQNFPSHPQDKPTYLTRQTDTPPGKRKKKLNNKQCTENYHKEEGGGLLKCTREGGEVVEGANLLENHQYSNCWKGRKVSSRRVMSLPEAA